MINLYLSKDFISINRFYPPDKFDRFASELLFDSDIYFYLPLQDILLFYSFDKKIYLSENKVKDKVRAFLYNYTDLSLSLCSKVEVFNNISFLLYSIENFFFNIKTCLFLYSFIVFDDKVILNLVKVNGKYSIGIVPDESNLIDFLIFVKRNGFDISFNFENKDFYRKVIKLCNVYMSTLENQNIFPVSI